MFLKLLYLGIAIVLAVLAGWLGWFLGVQHGTAAATVDSAISVRIAREALEDNNVEKARRALDDRLETTVLELGRVRHQVLQGELQWATEETILQIDKFWKTHPRLTIRPEAITVKDPLTHAAVTTVHRNLDAVIAEAKQRRASR